MIEDDEYWTFMNDDYSPLFTNIDWNNDNQSTTTTETFLQPMEFYEQKLSIPPFQRRRSSSVDLPINPLYIHEDYKSMKIGSSSVRKTNTHSKVLI
jgi:hypothetical protein